MHVLLFIVLIIAQVKLLLELGANSILAEAVDASSIYFIEFRLTNFTRALLSFACNFM